MTSPAWNFPEHVKMASKDTADSDSGDKQAQQSEDADAEQGDAKPVSKNKKYRKPKPWDHDGIDHWKVTYFCSGLAGLRC